MKIVERKPVPRGDTQFEANRAKILDAIATKIPKDLILPADVIENPSLDVTEIPSSCGLLTPEEIDITENYDLVTLAEAIASRKLTSLAVTTAFCRRAIIAHQLTFCLTELYMSEALTHAKELDDHLEKTGQTVGPLHGVPISIKEMVPVKGQICSLGLVVTRHISEEDCVLTSILRRLGCVFYVKTHQPAAVFAMEGVSFLGRTLNPHNIDLSPGGSSAGESALMAMHGSVFGIGTDIGGSIRIPAAFCGLYGLKGSHGFWPTEGMLDQPFPAGLNIDGIIGPLSRTIRDLDYVVKLVRESNSHLLDPEILPFPYWGLKAASGKDKSSLKIGIIDNYGLVQPEPPTAEVMAWTSRQLTSHGFNVKPFKFYSPAEAHRIYNSLLVPDGWKGVRGAMEAGNEPTYPVFEMLIGHAISQDPNAKSEVEETALTIAGKKFERDTYRSRFLADWIAQGDPDIVVTPMSPATPHDMGELRTGSSNTHYYNLLDYPALIVPTKFKARKRDEYDAKLYEDVQPLNEADTDTKKMWREHEHFGAPITLQIVAKRRHENELMAAVGLIKEALELP